MPPTDRAIISFAAEPPQEGLPTGRWADTLVSHFLDACHAIDADGEDLGEAGPIAWFPDRTYGRRTYVPAVAVTTTGYELFGFVSFSDQTGAPVDFTARAEFTSERAESNPDWKLDLNDDVIGSWRGAEGETADVTLVWGVPLVSAGAQVTAELGPTTVDQCRLVNDRFTLVAADNHRGEYLEVRLWDANGAELASESLYVDDGEDDDEDEADA